MGGFVARKNVPGGYSSATQIDMVSIASHRIASHRIASHSIANHSIGRDRSRGTCESRSRPYAMRCHDQVKRREMQLCREWKMVRP